LRLLRAGDKAKFIVPSHLAYGWIGDSKNIPTRAVLVYDVNVLQVRKLKSEF
jgi:FKBP-type peptidyl-prolyl cis-trans isomerase